MTLGALPETNATRGPLPEEFVRKQAASSERVLLGIALREESGGEGVLVQAVSPETQACAGGLVPGDVIRGLAGEPIGGYEQLLAVLGRARGQVASLLGAAPRGVIFTGSATEANNTALLGVLRARGGVPGHVVTSTIEHPSVEAPLVALEAEGWETRRGHLPVETR